MTFILYGIIIFLVLFTLWMFIATAAIGTKYLKTTQYFMSSLEFNTDADEKIKLILNKYENGLLTAIVDKALHVIRFHDANTGEFNSEIWVGSKYSSYGMLYTYGSERNRTWSNYKPSLKSFKRIISLEKKLISELPETVSETVNKSTETKSDTIVLK